MTDIAVISLSGGLDSCVTAAIAKAEGYELALLHADYGQLTESREQQAFLAIADFYAIPEGNIADRYASTVQVTFRKCHGRIRER